MLIAAGFYQVAYGAEVIMAVNEDRRAIVIIFILRESGLLPIGMQVIKATHSVFPLFFRKLWCAAFAQCCFDQGEVELYPSLSGQSFTGRKVGRCYIFLGAPVLVYCLQ